MRYGILGPPDMIEKFIFLTIILVRNKFTLHEVTFQVSSSTSPDNFKHFKFSKILNTFMELHPRYRFIVSD